MSLKFPIRPPQVFTSQRTIQSILTLVSIAMVGSFLLYTPRMAFAQSAEPDSPKAQERMLVVDLSGSEKFDAELPPLLTNLVVTYFKEMDHYQVTSQADITALIGLEQERMMTGCDSQSCMAEIGMALGAKWMVQGDLGKLGESPILTLKLIDVDQASIKNQVTQTLEGGEANYPPQIRQMTYDLAKLEMPKDPRAKKKWYKNPWTWVGIGAGLLVIGSVSAGVVLSAQVPENNLGVIQF